jgi:glycosyltransferase involved in cell wall biosynthesis
VRVFRNAENLGYRLNFIQATSLCRGSVVSFCDQDDIWDREKVSRLRGHFARCNDLGVSHDFGVIFDDGRAAIPSYFQFLELSGFPLALCVKGCSLAFRRELIERFGWPGSQSNASHGVWVCLTATLIERRGYLRDPLVTYRIHVANATGLLFGGSKPIARILRRFPLPPFTSRDERDLTLGFLIPGLLRDNQHDFVRGVITAASGGLTASQRAYALAGLERNRAIRALIATVMVGRGFSWTFSAAEPDVCAACGPVMRSDAQSHLQYVAFSLRRLRSARCVAADPVAFPNVSGHTGSGVNVSRG